MPKPKKKSTSRSRSTAKKKQIRQIRFAIIVTLLGVSLFGLAIQTIYTHSHNTLNNSQISRYNAIALQKRLHQLERKLDEVRRTAMSHNDEPADISRMQSLLRQSRIAMSLGQYDVADILLTDLENDIAQIGPYNRTAAKESIRENNNEFAEIIPIMIYHKTPADFDAQLNVISAKGYHTITMKQLSDHFEKAATLPPKPLIITFDDGFENQLEAYQLLAKHHMVATYYVIVGGKASNYCIGAERTNESCGDTYLTWEQVRTLDQSGIIEIGAHTVDHVALGVTPDSVAKYQIIESKRIIEHELGHAITTFAYPYGSFNPETPKLVADAGFSSAVSTIPGYYQSLANLFTLERVRHADQLP